MNGNKPVSSYKRIIILAGSALILTAVSAPGSVVAGRLDTRISSGYDSFIDRYTVLEDDTTESFSEYYINITNKLAGGIKGINSTFRNSLKFGNQTLDERLRLGLEFGSLSSIEARLETDFFLKHFREGSDYVYSNNYRQINTGLKLSRRISENLRIRSRTRFEVIDYDDHTSFDYDYNYIDTGIECDAGSILGNTFRAAAAFGVCESPDTTELNYHRSIIQASAYLGSWAGSGLDITVSADRRSYQGDSRPSSWLILSYSNISVKKTEEIEFGFTLDGESYLYDSTSQLYFDTYFIRGGVEISLPLREDSELSFQPRYARMLCPDLEDERYSEYSMAVSYNFMHGIKYWFTLSYEPGYRRYLVEDIYSNFYFNRVSLMGSFTIYRNISADLFLMHDPEKHSRRRDDFSITLISATISLSF
ncbi:MAG: hypothetical protein R6U43_01470 [Candidatus Krumholzibacteriales bacterium]